MELQEVEIILNAGNPASWTIKGEHLCYENGDRRFLFDKISEGLFAFNKLVLVSDGRLIPMSFFDKRRIHHKVVDRLNTTKTRMQLDAIQKMRKAAAPPPPPKSRKMSSTIPVPEGQTMDEAVARWGQMAQSGGLSSEQLGGMRARPSIPDEGKLAKKVKGTKEAVEKTLSDAERKSEKFRENVEKEKARIRKLLRKKTADSGPR